MKPNCMKCKHYYVTYDKNTPRGCRIYKVQSSVLPSLIVKRANNGDECIGFQPKQTKTNTKKDFNDPKYW